jgi:hypothetical protein
MELNLDNWPWTEEEKKELEEIEKYIKSLPKLATPPNEPKLVTPRRKRRPPRMLTPEEVVKLQEEMRKFLRQFDK